MQKSCVVRTHVGFPSLSSTGRVNQTSSVCSSRNRSYVVGQFRVKHIVSLPTSEIQVGDDGLDQEEDDIADASHGRGDGPAAPVPGRVRQVDGDRGPQ